MRSQTWFVASLSVAIGLAAVPAHSQRGGVQAHIPCKFAVAGKTFPAGEYMVIAASHQVRVQDANGRIIAVVLANDISNGSAGVNGRIIFHCYGDHSFLAELWSPHQENGRQLLTSRTEAELAKEERGKYLAVVGEKPGP